MTAGDIRPPSVVRSSRRSGTSVTTSGRMASARSTIAVVAAIWVQHAAHRLPQQLDIAILDVPTIFTQVHRDAMRTCKLAERGGPDRIWIGRAARLTQRRDVIDADVQRDHNDLVERAHVDRRHRHIHHRRHATVHANVPALAQRAKAGTGNGEILAQSRDRSHRSAWGC